ncbi:MAG: amidohydrolase family protein [Candidatus Latescibacteria bacterium]|jgi:L-fuconolactonase|nr:amidohydrolase family protein [Candidatus Latescibacterota bacterium]
MLKVDAHLHVFTKASREFPREISDRMPAERDESVEKLMTSMDSHGIDQAVLVQIGGTNIPEHAYLLDCLKRYPGKFRGIGLIPPDCDAPEDHMDKLADGTGIIGFRLNHIGGPSDPFAPIDIRKFENYRVWKHAAKKDYVLWVYLRARDAHLLGYMADAFPQVRTVINHLGVCPGEGRFSWDELGRPQCEIPAYPPAYHTTHRLGRYENISMLLSGHYAFSREDYPYRDFASWHQSLMRTYGSHRLMWATDFPWILENPGYGPLTKIINELTPDISADQLDDIMGSSARRILRFPDLPK